MRIEEEIKLDYSDVLFRPKRSTLKSRKEVDLSRTYKFKHSNKEWSGVPIIASNMDGVGELKVANSLAKHRIVTALTKHHDLQTINEFKLLKFSGKNSIWLLSKSKYSISSKFEILSGIVDML